LNLIQGNRLDLAGETTEISARRRSRPGSRVRIWARSRPACGRKSSLRGIVSSGQGRGVRRRLKGRTAGRCISPGAQRAVPQEHDHGVGWEKEGWTAPVEAAFAKGFPTTEPYNTPDGRKLYYGCNRTKPAPTGPNTRSGSSSGPRPAPGASPVITARHVRARRPKNGNLYNDPTSGPRRPGQAGGGLSVTERPLRGAAEAGRRGEFAGRRRPRLYRPGTKAGFSSIRRFVREARAGTATLYLL